MEQKDVLEVKKFQVHCTVMKMKRDAAKALQSGDYRRAQDLIKEIMQLKARYKV